MVLGGFHWVREGFEELIDERVVGIDILMLSAAVGSAILGMWNEAAFLVFLYGAAEGIEEYTYAKTRSSIRALLDYAPKTARILEGANERSVPAKSASSGTDPSHPSRRVDPDGRSRPARPLERQ